MSTGRLRKVPADGTWGKRYHVAVSLESDQARRSLSSEKSRPPLTSRYSFHSCLFTATLLLSKKAKKARAFHLSAGLGGQGKNLSTTRPHGSMDNSGSESSEVGLWVFSLFMVDG